MQTKKELPDGRFVFAGRDDFSQIKALWQEAFDDDDGYIDSFLSENFNERRIILFKNGDEIISMASLFFVEFDSKKAVYIFALATKKEYGGRGVATELLNYVQTLFECAIILQPEKNGVEKFYQKIGFTLLEAEKFYRICKENNITNLTLGKFDGYIRSFKSFDTSGFSFKDLEPDDIENIYKYFSLSKNKSCESTPLCLYLYRHCYTPVINVQDSVCFVLYRQGKNFYDAGLPYCKENELAKYFKIQEKYFNENLKKNHIVLSAHEEGVEALKNSGVLDRYDIKECVEFRDYLYSGETMRTLSGKKLSKKRNLIHQFEKNFDGRWEYASLTPNDKKDVADFLEKWYENHPVKDSFFSAEYTGILDVINHDKMYSIFKFGCIKIDGEIKAVSIGSYNPKENMAIIETEKADAQITGLYQIINREFLLHEFPDVTLVNREDDAGEENLRHAKMSYNPIGFEKKYILKQRLD